MNELSTESYQILHDPENHIVRIAGSMQLQSNDTLSVEKQFIQAADAAPDTLFVDLTDLNMINCTGITSLTRFLIHVRDQRLCNVLIRGNQAYDWQRKSLRIFQRIMRDVHFSLTWT